MNRELLTEESWGWTLRAGSIGREGRAETQKGTGKGSIIVSSSVSERITYTLDTTLQALRNFAWARWFSSS